MVWHFAPCVTLLCVGNGFKRWPHIFKRWPYRFKRWPPPRVWCGTLLYAALCSVWGMDSRGPPTDLRGGPPPCVWRDTLLRVALSSIRDPADASTIVGYILVIPTPGMLCRTPIGCAINKSNSAGDMSIGDAGVQEYTSTRCLIAV